MRVFYLTLTVSIALVLAGFFSPPLGVIDDSVLTAVGLLLMFAALAQVPAALRSGRNIKITHADISAEISSNH